MVDTQDDSINKLVTMVRTPRFEYCRDEKSHYLSKIFVYGRFVLRSVCAVVVYTEQESARIDCNSLGDVATPSGLRAKRLSQLLRNWSNPSVRILPG